MTEQPPPTEKKHRVRFTKNGRTVFYTAQASSGFVLGLGALPGLDINRFHLTVVPSKDGFRSHITDQLGELPRVELPKRSQTEAIRFLKSHMDLVGKYRWNEVAWLPVGEMAVKLEALLTPEKQGKKEVVPIERLRERIEIDLRDPKQFRKLRLTELAKLRKPGYRFVSGRLHMVFPTTDGAKLHGTPVRLQNFMNGMLSLTGFDVNGYLAFLQEHSPQRQGSRQRRQVQRR